MADMDLEARIVDDATLQDARRGVFRDPLPSLLLSAYDRLDTVPGPLRLVLNLSSFELPVDGVVLIAEGSALSSGLVDVRGVTAMVMAQMTAEAVNGGLTAIPFERLDGGRAVARLPGVRLAPSMPAADLFASGASPDDAWTSVAASMCSLGIQGEVRGLGAGILRFMALPLREAASPGGVYPLDIGVLSE